jgi:hypothetical protein
MNRSRILLVEDSAAMRNATRLLRRCAALKEKSYRFLKKNE